MSDYLALALGIVFGIAYNAAFDHWGRHQNIAALWVVFGVLVTLALAATPLTPSLRLQLYWHGERVALSNAQHAALHVLKFFVATGTPMFLGAMRRALQAREAAV